MTITTSVTVVRIVEEDGDSMVEWLITIGNDGIGNIQRSLFIDDTHETTENNPDTIPDRVKEELQSQVSRVAQAQGEINKL